MKRQKKYIKLMIPEVLLVFLILFAGFILFGTPDSYLPEKPHSTASSIISVSQIPAICFQEINTQLSPKSGISITDDFNLLSSNKIPFLENRNTDIKIFLLQSTHKNLRRIQFPGFTYYLFPEGNDESPLLS